MSILEKVNAKRITPRKEDFSQWYLDVVEAADLAEHGPWKGSMIIKPYGFSIWDNIKNVVDAAFKETGVENAYFPLFIPESFLKKEKEHVEGFAPEVAVVTHAGGKKLDEPLVVRPTSETIIYDAFSKWIHSYRDLPVVVNQWVNVVRWELRPRLFLRTTEFLWQEGHTAHATNEDADERARKMLDVYKTFAEDHMAIPVFAGIKSDSEKFAGALYTYAVEAMMQDGKALQLATSHNLGQNFAKVFNISFTKEDNSIDYTWQTSWGLSTRTIGGLIMTHADDKGLVLPPKIAPIQAVLVPIWSNDADKKAVSEFTQKVLKELKPLLTDKIHIDERELSPGEKFYHWEKRGVPLRIEIGPKDVAKNSVVIVRRDTSEKAVIAVAEVKNMVSELLKDIQKSMYETALNFRNKKVKEVNTWDEFVAEIEAGNFVLAHWCGDAQVEAEIKEKTKATVRCIPFDQKEEKGVCILSGKPSNKRVLFARSY